MSDSDSDPFEVAGLAGDSAFDSEIETTPKRGTVVAPRASAAEKKPAAAAAPAQRGSGAVKLRALDAASALDCPVCGKSNAADYKFCRGCGSEAEVGGAPVVAEVVKKPAVVGRGRGTPTASLQSSSEEPIKRAVGRARPPPKPPAASTSPAPTITGPAVDRSSSLEERKHKRGDSNPPGEQKAAAATASATASAAKGTAQPGVATARPPSRMSVNVGQGEEDSPAQSRSKVASGNFEILDSRTADDATRQFLLEVVRSHEEGIREGEEQAAPGTVATVADRRKPRAPTVKLVGTWNKASGRKVAPTDGSVMSWSSLGLDAMAEMEGGMPQAVFQAVQYFVERRCYNYPGLFKTPGSPAKVNRILETMADGSFAGFDAVEATPLDVLACLRTFLLIVPDSPVPGTLFYELLDACYEVDKATQVAQVRAILMRVSSPCRGVLKAAMELCRNVLASQSGLQLGDAAQYFGPGLVRPSEGAASETDPQSYAILLALLEIGGAAFDSKGQPDRAVTASPTAAVVVDNARVLELEEELKQANEKIASLTRQLDEARKGSNLLKKKLDMAAKETGELKRKLADNEKVIDSWKANAVLDMY